MFKKIIIFKLLFFGVLTVGILSCTSTKSNHDKIETCKCSEIIKAFELIDYQCTVLDSLIGPKVIWYNQGFEENEEIALLKKCTNLEIDYIANRRGYYLFTKQKNIYVDTWLKANCAKQWRKHLKNKPLYLEQKIDDDKLKVDEIIIEKTQK